VNLKKVLILIFFFSIPPSINATELGGIKILQSTDDFITLDDNDKRKRKYNNNVKIYLNNSFNLSSEEPSENAKNWNDFIIPKPDFFYNEYFVYEKEKKIIKIYSIRSLSHKEPQSTLKVGECESLKKQLMLEKLGSKFDESNKLKQYLRSANDDRFYFKDRTIFNYKIENNNISHLFTCNYKIEYIDNVNNSGEHLVTNLLFEAISLNDEFVKEEKFSNYKQIEKFNSNFIKNFKIWGNFKEINYDNNETYSLNDYRLKSLLKHNEIKTLQKIEIEKEKQKKIKEEKISKLKKEIENKKEKLSQKIYLLEKPIFELNKKLDKRFNATNKLLNRIKNQEKDFKFYFDDNYDDCFPTAVNRFISGVESVYVSLTLTNKKDPINYSINYEAFNDDDRSLFFLDFVKDRTKCQVDFAVIDTYDTLDLNYINFRVFNKFVTYNLEIPIIKSKTKSKLIKLDEEIKRLDKEIEEYNEIISQETTELKKKFDFEVVKIQKQILVLNKNYSSKLLPLILPIPKTNSKDIQIKEKAEIKAKKNQDRNIENNGLTLSEVDALKAQIFGCWSIPLGLPYNENLLVRIKIKLRPDGTIISTEMLDHARMNKPGQGFYKVLAESALRAIKLCQPLRVPATGYERWKEFQLNFDASEMLKG